MINLSILPAVEAIKQGKIVILIDSKDRENEGDFIQASEFVTPESVNFMITHGKGLVCQVITKAIADQFKLYPQTSNNTSLHNTQFTVSFDARHGTTTGISAYDRALAIKCLVSNTASSDDIAIPGHIFPIVAHEGGLLARDGHTEGSIALTKLAGLQQNAVICEVLNEQGYAATRDELQVLAKKHNLEIVYIEDLIEYLQGE